MARKGNTYLISSLVLNVFLVCWLGTFGPEILLVDSAIGAERELDHTKSSSKLIMRYHDSDWLVYGTTNDMSSCAVYTGGRLPFSISCYSARLLRGCGDEVRYKYSIQHGSARVSWKQDDSGMCFDLSMRVNGRILVDKLGNGVWREIVDVDKGEDIESEEESEDLDSDESESDEESVDR